MTSQKFDLDNLRIATPCPVGWEAMKGDDRKRFCDLCSLNVYNISEMTRGEAEALIANSEGRVCARIYRRADGTVITRDCPVGLRAYRKRISRFAGATLAMMIGLFSSGYGQSDQKKDKDAVSATKLSINKTMDKKGETGLSGVVTDMYGAVIPDVHMKLTFRDTGKRVTATSDSEGRFSFAALIPGLYTLETKSDIGFKRILIDDLNLERGTLNDLVISLEADGKQEIVGILAIGDFDVVPDAGAKIETLPLERSLGQSKKP